MLISYNWLKQYIHLKEPVETVLERLVHAGVAVENVKHLGRDITQVVVAELLSVEKHPQADRLSLTKVSVGNETFQVVCGAKNIAPGQKVPLAKVGAILPGNFEIKTAKIRGVESFGMLCSAKELGLAEDAEGILILPPEAPLGVEFLSYMGLPDTLFELEITPNRADLLSHWGVARELGALFHKPVQYPKARKLKENSIALSKLIHIKIEVKDLCHLYTCRAIEGVKVGPSPQWLVQTLAKMGQRSINNIVDVTNFVLLETGQPLHAFDLNQIHGRQIIIRTAAPGEKIPLLDNTERELKNNMMVIADAERPIALAGIMGGSNSQVTPQTQNILLESALFLPGSVRKTARSLGISTDSSYRFERGVDPAGVRIALERATALILEVAGGHLAKGVGSVSTKTSKAPMVSYRPQRSNAVLGLEIAAKAQIEVLKNLGCKVKGTSQSKTLSVQCPTYRLDLTREIDLIEEMARLSGYEKIPVVPPNVPSFLFPMPATIPFEMEIRSTLHQAGFYEAVNSTFLASNFPQKLKLEEGHLLRKFQEVANPISEDQRVLRPTLLPSLLANIQLNLSHQQETACLYEINKVFTPGPDNRVGERIQATAIIAGMATQAQWYSPERKSDFYDIKGLIESVLAHCGIGKFLWSFQQLPAPYDPGLNFEVKTSEGQLLARGGALHPKVLKEYDIPVPAFALEMEPEAFAQAAHVSKSYRPLPKFPAAWRDIALVVPDGVTSNQVLETIEEMGKPDLKKVHLFDLYRGPHLSAGVRSLAYRMQFLNEERTLTDQEVAQKVSRIVDGLKSRYSIALR
ncbi:MAG TPA: phenylalanine--tRNA ligase subunit beta [bacterium]|nr:phenylalanine--tRNA ligase subunit beta [bacterium]